MTKSTGLVNLLTGKRQALDSAMVLAGRIRSHSPQAVRITRRVIQATPGLDDRAAFTVRDPLTVPVSAGRTRQRPRSPW
ncbi:hypothetical protein ACFWVF_23955 [Streptomyces sp. NPDC058659]|uniref:hypothetical protein n=1 Tax=unclassified Streptomyces TaxID=2593676 RepID=UPI003651D339